MARKSRRAVEMPQDQVIQEQIKESAAMADDKLRTAAYVRLSVEHDDDDTIQNQAAYIKDYIEGHRELQLSGVYMDHGYSGTNFDRPEFSRLMLDVQSGLINCIVVKDLSRFGRNFLETGYYLEVLLPKLNVRLIAINDNYDSSREEDQENIAVPVKNMVNEMYAKDQSRKVSLANERARKLGTYTLEKAAYGYDLDTEENTFRVNPDTAPVVQLAFRWFLNGLGCGEIAKRFNMMGIITPKEYNCRYVFHKEMSGSRLWNSGKVRDILKRDVYAGDLVLGMRRTELYKNLPKDRKTSREEWTIHRDHHEAIIPREDMDKVHRILEMHVDHRRKILARNESINSERNKLFNSLVYCKKCNRIMYQDGKIYENGERRAVGNTYMCKGRIGTHNRNGCFQSINDDYLRVIVTDQIRKLAVSVVDTDRILHDMKKRQKEHDPVMQCQNRIGLLKIRDEECSSRVSKLYEDLSAGAIEQDDYTSLRNQYQQERVEIRRQINACRIELESVKERIRSFEELADTLQQYLSDIKLTRELVEMLIDRIYVDEGKVVEIRFKCRDVFQDVLELIKVGDSE